ncbi:MAG: D-alanyl-D-alanine carboxypeptidase/D-alanyl-D-alanine-endopeptidase [Prolixibacteraceae bacterium]|nr:D-alanyl-D-alanine carboxypeptidase/D-alanyl-D-alanine-endopeptidase [Prolixibacteraceae bacterium]
MKQFLLIFILFCLIFPAKASELNKNSNILDFISSIGIENASVSIYVSESKTGKTLLASDPQLCITPASTLKLITSATALQLSGSDYTFKTIIWTDGMISNGTLSGNLIITGGGDPTLGSSLFNKNNEKKKFLSEWVHAIKIAGIDTITGNITIDPFIFSDQDIPRTWIWEDIGNYYGAAAKGIALYDNTFEIIFNTSDTIGRKTEIVKYSPQIPDLTLKNEVISSSETRDNAYIFGSPYDNFRIIKGTLPTGKKGFSVKASIPDPAKLLAYELKEMMKDSLINVAGSYEVKKQIDFDKIDESKKILEWKSPPLSEIIEKLNHESINLYAEHLLKHIGLTVKGKGTSADGIIAIKEFWTNRGVDTKTLFMADGSGLSRFNAVTAKNLVDILDYMYQKSPYYNVFLKSIPVSGQQGTQKNYFQDSFLKGKAHLKTGSMTRVRSFAGYMTTQSGNDVSVAIIINNYTGSSFEIKKLIEKFFESVYLKL